MSALGFLLLSALYISSISSCLATLYGTPRVLQSIASENVIPAMAKLADGVSQVKACLKGRVRVCPSVATGAVVVKNVGYVTCLE